MSRDVHRLCSHCYLCHKPIISIFQIFLPKVIESFFFYANLFLFAKCARAYETCKQCLWIMRTHTYKHKIGGKIGHLWKNIRSTTISAQILHESKTKWRVAPKRKTGAAAKHLLKQTADCTALQSQIDWTIEPWNHWTKNLKSLKNIVCCRRMPGSNKWE